MWRNGNSVQHYHFFIIQQIYPIGRENLAPGRKYPRLRTPVIEERVPAYSSAIN